MHCVHIVCLHRQMLCECLLTSTCGSGAGKALPPMCRQSCQAFLQLLHKQQELWFEQTVCLRVCTHTCVCLRLAAVMCNELNIAVLVSCSRHVQWINIPVCCGRRSVKRCCPQAGTHTLCLAECCWTGRNVCAACSI